MIGRLIEICARNPLPVILLTAIASLWGWWSMQRLPLDAIPDLSETQVIIYSRWDRSADIIEDQVTYPLVTAMMGGPRVKTVRGVSDFGYSFVYVIFEEGTDIYWARSRTTEYLAGVLPRLPEGVRTELGPDATGLAWVFQYALVDTGGRHSLADLRSLQDWYLRYHLKSVPGVAEVAPVGGFVRQYQVSVDPNRLRSYGVPVRRVVEAVRGGNSEVGGRLIELGGAEYMVRGKGYARSPRDFEEIVVAADENGAPLRVRDVATVTLGPDLRRGVTDLDGQGEAVSGIVVMRQGENALQVIGRVKEKIREISAGLPAGVSLLPVYDRSELIRRAIDTLKGTLAEIIVTVSLVIFLFLRHPPSALIPALTIPVAVLVSFIPFRMMGLTANIMSLGGIAIAIGAMVDASIVVVEQTHKRLELWMREGSRGDPREAMISAMKEVGPPGFFALLVIAVAFLPVLALQGEEGRLFRPLALTKNLSIFTAAFLAVTFDPALRLALIRLRPFSFRPFTLCRWTNRLLVGRIREEGESGLSRLLVRVYEPVVTWALERKAGVAAGALLLVLATIPAFLSLGSEFMPPLDEGTLLYMPSTMPGISVTEAQRVLQATDRVIARFPEVERVLGKAGRAESSTDPAPLSMLETVIVLKPRDQWRSRPAWYSSWPEPLQWLLRRVWPDRISREELVAELNEALRVPGLSNAWTMPVKGRIDMLTTGIRTPLGLKISGSDPAVIETIGVQAEGALRGVPGTRSVFSERSGGGYYLDFGWKREALARYGLSVEELQPVVANAVGGENVTVTVEGRERYGVNVRYRQECRSDPESLGRLAIPAGTGGSVPLGEVCDISVASGPSMIRDEDGLLTGYVYVDLAGGEVERYVREAAPLLREALKLPPGYSWSWSGEFEEVQRVRERMKTVLPATLLLIAGLLYWNTRSAARTALVLLAVPFSAVGAVWLIWLLDYNLSVGVWVGITALLGVDAETGVFMLLYLDLAWRDAAQRGDSSPEGLRRAVLEGAVRRLRPKVMTVATMFLGLVPIMWSTGAGSDVMKRIAAPMIGGIFTSFLLELLIYPVIYEWWMSRSLAKKDAVPEAA